MEFVVLPGLPATGPEAEPFPSTGQAGFREGLVVRFLPEAGEPWVGNFQPGLGGMSKPVRHPDGRHVLVISGGQGYVVDPTTRRGTAVPSSAIAEVFELPELQLLVLDHQGIRFEAVGSEGTVWSTRRISWDGFRNVTITGNTLTGEAWDPMGGGWMSFSVDLLSGAARGGSYSFQDAASWERLRDAGHTS